MKRNCSSPVLGWAAGCAAAFAAHADIVTRNAATPAEAPAMRTLWLADCGVAAPTFTVDFETGFTDGQNVSAIAGLFPAGLVITDSSSAHAATVRTGTAFGGAMPNGVFGLAQNERPYLELAFPAPGVDGFSLADIDHTGTAFIVRHADGATSSFSIESTGGSGRAGEFIGVWRNDKAPIILVQMDASGDGTWGIDDIQWVVACRVDFNGDGFVDFFDYDDYVRCFESGDCPPDRSADFNGDGFADFFDYLDFVAGFETGC